MTVLFLRAVLLYIFILIIIRLTGKRQISDLQPFDLLITLTIADIASCAIADTDVPLLYIIVPILALFLVQQLIAKLCLKSPFVRRVFCGSPLILVRDGVLMERTMRFANYTVGDLVDCLRAKDVFDIGQVAFAILETNGSVSVLQKGAFQQPTLSDLGLDADESELSYMLVTDGAICKDAIRAAKVSVESVKKIVADTEGSRLKNVLYLQLAPDGVVRLQLRNGKVIEKRRKELDL